MLLLATIILLVVFVAALVVILRRPVSRKSHAEGCDHLFYPLGDSAQSCALCGKVVHRPDVAAMRAKYLSNKGE